MALIMGTATLYKNKKYIHKKYTCTIITISSVVKKIILPLVKSIVYWWLHRPFCSRLTDWSECLCFSVFLLVPNSPWSVKRLVRPDLPTEVVYVEVSGPSKSQVTWGQFCCEWSVSCCSITNSLLLWLLLIWSLVKIIYKRQLCLLIIN